MFAAFTESLRDLAAYKHAITIEAEEQKEHARLESIKGVDRSKAAYARVGRKGRKPDPMGPRPSRSVSRSRAASPSPSPSSPIALDKTPTKADFTVGMKVDEDASLPVVGGPTNPNMDAQSAVAPTCVGRMNPPLGVFGDGTPPGPLWEGQRPVEDRAADASPGEARTFTDNRDVAPLSHLPNVPSQVTAPPSTTPTVPADAENDEARILRLLGSVIGPLRKDISGLANDVNHLTARVGFLESTDEVAGDVGAADPANWGTPPPPDINLDSYDAHIPCDPSAWAEREIPDDADAVMGYDDEYERKCNEPNDWFFQLFTSENGLVSGSPLSAGQLSEVAILQDMWYDFCHDSHSNTHIPPPLPPRLYATPSGNIARTFAPHARQLSASPRITPSTATEANPHPSPSSPRPDPHPHPPLPPSLLAPP